VARPITVPDEVLLDAAFAVFRERGMSATTAEVARRAGVSEGLLFRRFRSKERLFREAMGHGIAPGGQPFPDLVERLGEGSPAERLFRLGMHLLATARLVVPVVMMSWSHQDASGGMAEALAQPDPLPHRVIKRLGAFFEAEMRAGRLRAADPEVVARTLLGSIWHFTMMELLMPHLLTLPAETYVRGVVDLVLRGLEPAPNRRA
jgi:AcrR family transcriptional regulator